MHCLAWFCIGAIAGMIVDLLLVGPLIDAIGKRRRR
jgi:hypothetical protein